MKRSIAMLLAVALVALVWLGCSKKSPVALGEEWKIYAVADATDWEVVGPIITEALEKKLVTPQTETEYEVVHVDPKDFNKYLRMRNLLLISSLEPGTEMDRILRRAIPVDIYDKIVKKEQYFYMAKNQWAQEQFIVILAAPGREALKASVEAYPDYVYQIFDRNRNQRVRWALFLRTNGRLEKRLKKEFGWTIKIPFYYELVNVDTVEHVVHLKSPAPERHILVHWIDNPDRKKVNASWLESQFAIMGRQMYSATLVDGYTYSSKGLFQGRPTLSIMGLWESQENAMGGPIKVFAFYDRSLDRIYVMALAVFARDHKKEPFLRELNLIAETFMTAAEEKRPAELTMK